MQQNHRRAARLGIAALALAGTLTAGLAAAQPGPGQRLRELRAALATLDLTDQQKADIKAFFEAKKPTFQALREQAKADRQALKAALDADTPDPAAVGKAFLKVHANRQEARAQAQGVRDELKSILTPEQLAKLRGFMAGSRHARGMGMSGAPPAQQK